jgi:hypothetical protein
METKRRSGGWATSLLRLRYARDPNDDFSGLTVEIETGSFRGTGGCEVQWQDLEDFAARLGAPIFNADAPVIAAWGDNQMIGDDLRLRIGIRPCNPTGDLNVEVEVADTWDKSQRLRASFVSNYGAIDDFRLELRGLAQGRLSEATLRGAK